MSKNSARDRALAVLYAVDLTGDEPELTGLPRRVAGYVNGVMTTLEDLDREISAVATGWRIERMPVVDRNIIRLAPR